MITLKSILPITDYVNTNVNIRDSLHNLLTIKGKEKNND
jgi:hypothetical protein